MTSLEYAFTNDISNDTVDNFCYIEIDESTLLHRKYITKDKIFSNDDLEIEVYPFIKKDHLDYITNYIYPFWKVEFLNQFISKEKIDIFNPYSAWSNDELAKHNMGLKDNTICFELKSSEITIGFCSILLLDKYDRDSKMSLFNNDVFNDSIIFYNFVIEKPFRGKGYGSIFLQKVLKYINSTYNNYKYIVLYVDKINQKAIDLYLKNKFYYVCENPNNSKEDIYRYDIEFI